MEKRIIKPETGNCHQESSCPIVENFIFQEIPCQIVGSFKIKGWSMRSPFSLPEIFIRKNKNKIIQNAKILYKQKED